MRLLPSDREWLKPRKVVQYVNHEGDDPDVGKYNGGQKLFFFATALFPGWGALVLADPILRPAKEPPLRQFQQATGQISWQGLARDLRVAWPWLRREMLRDTRPRPGATGGGR